MRGGEPGGPRGQSHQRCASREVAPPTHRSALPTTASGLTAPANSRQPDRNSRGHGLQRLDDARLQERSDYTQALLDGARARVRARCAPPGSGVPPVVPAGGNEMGLSTAEVLRLREEFGYNEVKEKSVPAWKKFALNFWGPMPFLIELATIVSLVLRDWKDFAFLFALLLINGIVAFVEEFKAGNAIDALKNSLAPTARVLRDGAWTVLDAKELVPNDVVMMRLGDIVPADAKLCAGEPMEIDQSALTGESLPVTKYEGETVFQGSAIKRGELKAIVTHTGENSFFGKAAMLVDSVEKVGNFQKVLWNVAKILVAMATVLVRRPAPPRPAQRSLAPRNPQTLSPPPTHRPPGARHLLRPRLRPVEGEAVRVERQPRALPHPRRGEALPRPPRRVDPDRDAGGVHHHDGGGLEAPLREEGGGRAALGDRGARGDVDPLLRQDRHAHQEPGCVSRGARRGPTRHIFTLTLLPHPTSPQLTLGEPHVIADVSVDELIFAAALACKRNVEQEPIDKAICDAPGADASELDRYAETKFVPFDPIRKRTEATLCGPDGSVFSVSKGSPQVICDLVDDPERARGRSPWSTSTRRAASARSASRGRRRGATTRAGSSSACSRCTTRRATTRRTRW